MSGPEFDFESNGLAIAWIKNRALDVWMGRPVEFDDDDLEAVARLLGICAAEVGGSPDFYEINDAVESDEPTLIDQIRARIAEKVASRERKYSPPSNVIPFPIHRTRRPAVAA